jgi:hypothetical protein
MSQPPASDSPFRAPMPSLDGCVGNAPYASGLVHSPPVQVPSIFQDVERKALLLKAIENQSPFPLTALRDRVVDHRDELLRVYQMLFTEVDARQKLEDEIRKEREQNEQLRREVADLRMNLTDVRFRQNLAQMGVAQPSPKATSPFG